MHRYRGKKLEIRFFLPKQNDIGIWLQVKLNEPMKNIPKDLVLVCDNSGSMEGTKNDVVKTAVTKILQNYGQTASSISILLFDITARCIYPKPGLALESFIADIHHSLTTHGRATSYDAAFHLLSQTLNQIQAKNPLVVIFLTDGLPNEGNCTVETVTQYFKKAVLPYLKLGDIFACIGVLETADLAAGTAILTALQLHRPIQLGLQSELSIHGGQLLYPIAANQSGDNSFKMALGNTVGSDLVILASKAAESQLQCLEFKYQDSRSVKLEIQTNHIKGDKLFTSKESNQIMVPLYDFNPSTQLDTRNIFEITAYSESGSYHYSLGEFLVELVPQGDQKVKYFQSVLDIAEDDIIISNDTLGELSKLINKLEELKAQFYDNPERVRLLNEKIDKLRQSTVAIRRESNFSTIDWET